ncbi:MAG: 16S rRNA (adenine(1518)-N(6)/adenine(1519)-N(6))-dimethyltransferase RsmA [Acidobacteria bacterium]|nr:16S rRNA (adenine(1518)-N(6)/adenine(1519)-N(6))-dimethyltransferase RsmA [Acidobacteriota bacterium]MCA1638881.1 16S rRNA (adenine(1518)-N(6)/adenine(1519)-N(6))-dimethyltransferase RsmA [Acidobacteriota bacterium]
MQHKKENSPFTIHRSPFAKKSFGQNFLVDQNYIDKIISALNPQKDETIIEIGAGRGALTEKLIESGAKIIAIELDRDLIPLLQTDFGRYENFTLIEQDALTVDFKNLLTTHRLPLNTKLVANLPYYISTAILQKLIKQRNCFGEMVLMLQREVVERITAEAGNRERGFLSVLVQAYLQTEKLFDVPPSAFRPAPKVWSSVIRLVTKNENEIKNEKLFREIISTGFAQKRKTILNNLKNVPPELREKFGDIETFLESCGINPQRRAETLTLDEWRQIYSLSI